MLNYRIHTRNTQLAFTAAKARRVKEREKNRQYRVTRKSARKKKREKNQIEKMKTNNERSKRRYDIFFIVVETG